MRPKVLVHERQVLAH
jgi:hypothetical protein